MLIFETVPDNKVFDKQHNSKSRHIYLHSKFVYVEKHMCTQISHLYRNVLQQQCNLEQKILKNILALAIHSLDAFAYHLMQGHGYMALLAGEVIHTIKCVPVKVKLAHTRML